MKNIRKVLSFILALMLLFPLTACTESGTSNLPPEFDKLVSAMLLPKEEGLKMLGLKETDMVQDESFAYKTGRTVDFCGGKFDLNLRISKCDLEGTEGIWRFEYTTVVQDGKAAAEVVSAIAKKFTEAYGRSLDPNNGQDPFKLHVAEVSVAEIQKILETSGTQTVDYWYVKELTSERTAKYAEYIAEANNPSRQGLSGTAVDCCKQRERRCFNCYQWLYRSL